VNHSWTGGWAGDGDGGCNAWTRVETYQSIREDRAMRLPRMTTRRWMIAVAIVAFLFGMADRSRRFSAIADLYDGHSEASVKTPD
jgi:hypothetical protein